MPFAGPNRSRRKPARLPFPRSRGSSPRSLRGRVESFPPAFSKRRLFLSFVCPPFFDACEPEPDPRRSGDSTVDGRAQRALVQPKVSQPRFTKAGCLPKVQDHLYQITTIFG